MRLLRFQHLHWSLIASLALLAPFPSLASRPFRVVVDPGHGGSDQGTVYSDGKVRVMEKRITLLLAREVAGQLRAKGYQVILTRTTDREISLGARTALANRLGADVFLSIHMNSTQGQGIQAEGVETYILNNATDASSRRLARLENSVLSPGTLSEDPEKVDVALILKDLRLDANLAESKRLACQIQGRLLSATRSRRVHQRDRGVRQALFHVLLGADMPSALLEAGFLSNLRDRALVLSPEGRRTMARAIAGAIERYSFEKSHPEASSPLSRCKVD